MVKSNQKFEFQEVLDLEKILKKDSSNKNDQATTKEIVEDRDQTKQKTQNQKILIYAGGFVVVAVLIYLFL